MNRRRAKPAYPGEVKKSDRVVMIVKDGVLPIPAKLVSDLKLQRGDLAGLRQLGDGRLEITFWRRLTGKDPRVCQHSSLPESVALVELIPASPRKRILLPAYAKMMKRKPGNSIQADLDAIRGDR